MFELLPEAGEVPGGAIDALSGEQQAKPKPRPTQERKKLKQMVKACVWCICRVWYCCSPQSNLGKVSEPVGV